MERLGLAPVVAAVAAVSAARMAQRRAINTEQIFLLQVNHIELFLHGPELRRPHPAIALWQQLPLDFVRLLFGEDVVRAVKPALPVLENVFTELGKPEYCLAVEHGRSADSPEHLQLALPGIVGVRGGQTHRQPIPFRPVGPLVVGETIAKPPLHIVTNRLSVGEGTDRIAVVTVKRIDAIGGRAQRHGVSRALLLVRPRHRPGQRVPELPSLDSAPPTARWERSISADCCQLACGRRVCLNAAKMLPNYAMPVP